MRSTPPEMTSSATAAREKCSRNKRKFRQDPPFPNQASSENHSSSSGGGGSCKNAGSAPVSSEGENWTPEATRSVDEAGTAKGIGGADSAQKECSRVSGGNSNKVSSARSYQEQLKFMRWFRSGQGKGLSQRALEGKQRGEGEEEHNNNNPHQHHNHHHPHNNKSSGAADVCEEVEDDDDEEDEEEEFCELEEVDWDDCTEGELEDLLVKSLGSLYNEAIDKLVARGHSSEDALAAVLKQGRCYGGKDAVSNIVESALSFLTTGNNSNNSVNKKHATATATATAEGGHTFADLKELQKTRLAEMVALLREVRPLLSKGDAMWCLLMCDMNVALACVMEDSAIPPLCSSKESPTNNGSGQSKVVAVASSSSSSSSSSAPPPPTSSSTSASLPSPPLASEFDPPLPLPTTSSTPNSPITKHSSVAPVVTPPPAHSATTLSPPSLPSPISSAPVSLSSPSSSSRPPPGTTPDMSDSIPQPPSSPPLVTSSNSELESQDECSSPSLTPSQIITNPSVTLDACELKDPLDVRKLEEEEKEEGIMNSSQIPAIAHCSLEQKVEDQEQRSSTESDKNVNTSENNTSISCESSSESQLVAEPSHEIVELSKEEGIITKEGLSSLNTSPSLGLKKQTNDLSDIQSSAHDSGDTEKPLDPVCPSSDANQTQNLQDDSSLGQPDHLSSNAGSVVEPEGSVNSALKLGIAQESSSSGTCERDSSTVLPSDAESSSSVNGAVTKVANIIPECLSKETTAIGKDVEDQKDDMIMKLIHRARELETQLQERTEWAKQKVMQAARRLSKDLQELKALRLEREEGQRLKKDKQALEDSTMKKLTDLEAALRKSSGQVDRANANVRKLEAENAEIRAEMEAAKLSASESQSSCEEIAKRERKYTKRAQAWEKQKAKLQEEISEEKRKITSFQQQLALAKERQQQAEVRWRQEEKAKEEATLRADYERRAREQAEAAAKRREESLRRKAESNYQRRRDEIQRLEGEIAQLRTTAEAAQLATSRWGPGVAVTPHMMELGNLHALKEHNMRLSRELSELQDMARRDVRRERECVMCMCEEMSVVFLPCAHQVVCGKCNDLHEKQGMRDCPSCRTPIKQRIRVYGVST